MKKQNKRKNIRKNVRTLSKPNMILLKNMYFMDIFGRYIKYINKFEWTKDGASLKCIMISFQKIGQFRKNTISLQ